jgi:protein-S-isoprenylcysteine O-methyltransferase Ste14
MRRGDYGYDAPIGLILFGTLTLVSAVIAAVTWPERPSAASAGYAVFFLANLASFWFTTRRGKFAEWDADVLRTLGAASVERRRLGWRFWWGNPIAATRLLSAAKATA